MKKQLEIGNWREDTRFEEITILEKVKLLKQMKKQYIFLTLAFLVLIIQNGFSQNNPYEAINKSLDFPVEPKLLWPWEDDLLKGKNVSDFNVSYKLTFSEKENTELVIDFTNFEKLVSAVYLKEQVSGKFLSESLEKSSSEEFEPVFEQTDGENILYIYPNGAQDQEEVYFFASSKDLYELIYFKYKPNTQEKDRLQFQLKKTLNK